MLFEIHSFAVIKQIQREIQQLYSAPYHCDCFDLSTPPCFVCVFSTDLVITVVLTSQKEDTMNKELLHHSGPRIHQTYK